MPIVHRIPPYKVQIYTNDHRPAHVHVIGPDGRCVFNLNCPDGPIELRELSGITAAQSRRLARALESEIQELCIQWRKIHGYH